LKGKKPLNSTPLVALKYKKMLMVQWFRYPKQPPGIFSNLVDNWKQTINWCRISSFNRISFPFFWSFLFDAWRSSLLKIFFEQVGCGGHSGIGQLKEAML